MAQVSSVDRIRERGARKSLRSIMYGRIVANMLLCGILSSACVYYVAETLFREIYRYASDSSEREAETRLKLFDILLEKAEEDSRSAGRAALLELERRFPSRASFSSASEPELGQLAGRLGVSEIYFVDAKGEVVATSFAPDLGLKLFPISASFEAFLHGLYGQGRIADQRLSQSTLTGIVNDYQYYSPKGSDFIIEISISLEDSVKRSFPNLGYGDFVDFAFGGSKEGSSSLARIVDLVSKSGISSWSLFQEKTDRTKYSALIAKAERGEAAVESDRNAMRRVRTISLSTGKADYGVKTYYAVFEFNLTPINRFRTIALLVTLGACGLATGLSFFAMKRSFDGQVAARIERLQAEIGRTAEGDYSSALSDYGSDEIGDIGRSIDAMVKTILDREDRLLQAQRLETVGAMAGGLAHDFNNILSGISGAAECIDLALKSGDAKKEELGEMTALIARTAKHGGAIVRSLLDFAGRREPEKREFDLRALASEAAALARAGAGASETVEVELRLPEAPLVAKGDERAILAAVVNLCINGIQAMTLMRGPGEMRGGTLLVSVEARPGTVAVIVKDEGVGIAPEEMGKILTPFYSTKPRGLGTGLGLSNALATAEAHGGRIEIASELGLGSTFTLILPR
jgi:Signal transduction histidine kinase